MPIRSPRFKFPLRPMRDVFIHGDGCHGDLCRASLFSRDRDVGLLSTKIKSLQNGDSVYKATWQMINSIFFFQFFFFLRSSLLLFWRRWGALSTSEHLASAQLQFQGTDYGDGMCHDVNITKKKNTRENNGHLK